MSDTSEYDLNASILWKIRRNLNNNRAQYLFIKACRKGALLAVKKLWNLYPNIDIHDNDEEVFRIACKNGNLELAKWLWDLNKNIDVHVRDEFAFIESCINGHLKLAKWLLRLGANVCDVLDLIYPEVCKKGNLAMIQWLNKITQGTNYFAEKKLGLHFACYEGHLDVMKLVLKTSKIDIHHDNEATFGIACSSGHLEIVKYLLEYDKTINIHTNHEYAFISACSNGHLEVAKWLWQIDKKYKFHYRGEEAFRKACINGHFEMAKWLWELDNRIDINATYIDNKTAFHGACKNGNLEIAQWLLQLKKPIQIHSESDYAFRKACTHGHLKVAQWLWQLERETKININDKYLFAEVCSNGHLDVAKWLCKLYPIIDSKINRKILIAVCKNGHLKIAKLLLQIDKNIDIHTDGNKPIKKACKYGHLDIATWLYESGEIDTSNIMSYLFKMCPRNCHLHIIKWLAKIQGNTGIPRIDHIFKDSCIANNLKVSKWLFKKYPNIDITIGAHKIFIRSCQYNHLEMARWLTTISCNYSIQVKNNEIKGKIIDNNTLILNLLKANQYKQIIQHLRIKSSSQRNENDCMVCYEPHKHIIMLPCKHAACLESLITFYISNNKKEAKKCFYCTNKFNWNECKSVKNICSEEIEKPIN